MISIPKLRAFSAVAEHGSFTVAARAQGVSTAALSARVTELEKELGVTLLQRTTRRVDLTNEGQRLWERAKRVLFDLDTITADLTGHGPTQSGRVVMSCVPTLAATLLADVIGKFAQTSPQVQVQLYDEPMEALRERLLRNEADFAIGPQCGPDLAFERLIVDHFVLACSARDPLAKRESITGRELERLPLITMARGSNVRKILDAYFESQNFVLRPRFEVQHHYTLGALVSCGLGYGPLPGLALRLTGDKDLVAIPIRKPVCERAIGIITRPGNRLPPAALALLDVIRRAFEAAPKRIRKTSA